MTFEQTDSQASAAAGTATSVRRLGVAALLIAAAALGWRWFGPTAEERAAAAVLARGGEVILQPAFVDCPAEVQERFVRRLRAGKATLKESPQLGEAFPDEELIRWARDGVRPRWNGSGAAGAVVLGVCAQDQVRLLALDAANGAVLIETAAPLVAAPSRGAARLHVTSRPAGAEVYLDHKRVGTTPLLLVDAVPGNHHVRVAHPLYRRADQYVSLKADATAAVSQTLEPGEGRIAVSTRPAGAEILVDGKPLTQTTPTVFGPLPSGEHTLELRRPPHGAIRKAVAVRSGGVTYLQERFDGVRDEPRASTWRDPVSGMEFSWVPGGCYEMGCGPWTDDCDPDETLHAVCVDGFWLGRYEVTQAQWSRLMGGNPSTLNRAPERAVAQVSWHDAQAYLRRLNAAGAGGFRLPTEAEWEYACRSGGGPEKFAGGDEASYRRLGLKYLKEIAWVGEGWDAGPFPVGKKSANGLGLFDMSGNVWEWVEDAFAPDAYLDHAPKNPATTQGVGRVVRGGSWFNHSRLARCSHRYRFAPAFHNADLGFRVARSAK